MINAQQRAERCGFKLPVNMRRQTGQILRAAACAGTGLAGRAPRTAASCHNLAVAVGRKERDLARGIRASAFRAWDGIIRLAHRPQGIGHFITVQAEVFVKRHTRITPVGRDALILIAGGLKINEERRAGHVNH